MTEMHSSLFDQTNGTIDLDVEGARLAGLTDEERAADVTAMP